jgi:hypothetical protein
MSPESRLAEEQMLVGLLQRQGAQQSFQYVAEQVEARPSFARECHPLLHH